jgi:SRSO17 transposase
LPEPAPAKAAVAVSLSVATHQGSLPVAYRLYLPKDWADDPVRRAVAGVPDEVIFQTKPEIALRQLRQTPADGVPPAVVLIDPAYGNDGKLRAGISELGLPYVAGMLPTTMVWRPGEAPLPPTPRSGRGRPAKRLRAKRHIGRSRPRHWLGSFRPMPGSRLLGATAATRR